MSGKKKSRNKQQIQQDTHKQTSTLRSRRVSIPVAVTPFISALTPSPPVLPSPTVPHTTSSTNNVQHTARRKRGNICCCITKRCCQITLLCLFLICSYVCFVVRIVPVSPNSSSSFPSSLDISHIDGWIDADANTQLALDLVPFLPFVPKIPLPFTLRPFHLLHNSVQQFIAEQNVDRPGLKAKAEGIVAHYPVVFVPGIVSTALEVWNGESCAKHYFRQRLWGSTLMIKSLLVDSACWLRHLSLNGQGLDPEGIKLRPAAGLEAADYFIGNFCQYHLHAMCLDMSLHGIWAKIIENLSDIGYDVNSMFMAAFDWRLSYKHLQLRDYYFTKLRYMIEIAKLSNHDRKCVIVCHSMGCNVFFYFLQWVESNTGGGGGKGWVDSHIESWVNVGGPMLGVPKSIAAMLSGEMKDTAEIAPFLDNWRQRVIISQAQILNIIRSYRSLPSLLPRGGNIVWGDLQEVPDKLNYTHNEDTHMTNAFLSFESPIPWPFPNMSLSNIQAASSSDTTSEKSIQHLTFEQSMELLRKVMPEDFELNDQLYDIEGVGQQYDLSSSQSLPPTTDQRAWSNPFLSALPAAPAMKIYCMYGVGLDTESGYVYHKSKEIESVNFNHIFDNIKRSIGENLLNTSIPTNHSSSCTHGRNAQCPQPPNHIGSLSASIPLFQLNTSYHNLASNIRNGVKLSVGDATVPLVSLGYMCVEGWKKKRFNPAAIKVITKEFPNPTDTLNIPIYRSTNAVHHVDIMGNYEMIDDLIHIAGIRIRNNHNGKENVLVDELQDQAKYEADEEIERFQGHTQLSHHTINNIPTHTPVGTLTWTQVQQRIVSNITQISARITHRLEKALGMTLDDISFPDSSPSPPIDVPSSSDTEIWSEEEEQALLQLLAKKKRTTTTTLTSPSLFATFQSQFRQSVDLLTHKIQQLSKHSTAPDTTKGDPEKQDRIQTDNVNTSKYT